MKTSLIASVVLLVLTLSTTANAGQFCDGDHQCWAHEMLVSIPFFIKKIMLSYEGFPVSATALQQTMDTLGSFSHPPPTNCLIFKLNCLRKKSHNSNFKKIAGAYLSVISWEAVMGKAQSLISADDIH